jgi:hypothetical protein
LEIILQEPNYPLELSIINLLREVLDEKDPVPNKRILVGRQRGKKGFFLSVQLLDMLERKIVLGPNISYENGRACRSEGGLRFALNTNLQATSAFILHIVHGHTAQLQLRSRRFNSIGEYFLLWNGRIQGKRFIVAVVRKLSSSRFIMALVNERYNTDKMDYFYLDKP